MRKKRNSKKNNADQRKSECKFEAKQTVYSISAGEIEEAVYRAIKRGQEDNSTKSKTDMTKMKWCERLWFLLNIIFFPFHIWKKNRLKEHIYDSVLVLVVSSTFMFCGRLLWLLGIIGMFGLPIGIIINIIGFSISIILQILVCFACVVMGSLFYLSGKEFSNEVNSEKIYAYSASFFAMVGCMVAIVTLLIQYF